MSDNPENSAFVLSQYQSDRGLTSARHRRAWGVSILLFFCFFYGAAFALLAPFGMVAFLAPPVFIAIFVVWALPEGPPPLRTLELFFFLFFAGSVLWPNYLALALPGMPWITIARSTGLPLGLLLLVCLSTSGAFRARLAEVWKGAPLIFRGIATFVLIEAFSIVFSKEKGMSVDKFLTAQLSFTAVFFASAYLFLKEGRALKWVKLFWALAVIVCLIGLAESRVHHPLWAGHIPKFLQVQDPNVLRYLSGGMRAGSGIYRVQSVFAVSVTLAEFLALCIPFVIHLVLGPYAKWTKVAAALSGLLMAVTVVLSNSRTGSIGFLIALLLYGFYWGYTRRRSGSDGGVFGAVVLYSYPVAAVVVLGLTFVVGRLKRLVWGGAETRASTDGRLEQWHMGVPKILSNPIGHGIGQGGKTLGYYDLSGLLTIDSYYLTVLLEFGVLGFLLYFGIWALGVVSAGRHALLGDRNDPELSLLAPAAISLAIFIFIKGVFAQQDNHAIVYMLLGMIVALTRRASVSEKSRSSGPSLPTHSTVRA